MSTKQQGQSSNQQLFIRQSPVPQSKYADLLAVIEELGKDIKPTYAGSRSATERLKRGCTKSDYNEGIEYLHTAGAVYRKNDVLHFSTRGAKLITFLMDLMLPFFIAYTLICQYLGAHHHECELKELCNLIQLWMAKKVQEENITPEVLSKDMIGNGVSGLANIGAVSLHKVGGSSMVQVKRTGVLSTHKKLSSLMKQQSQPQSRTSFASKL